MDGKNSYMIIYLLNEVDFCNECKPPKILIPIMMIYRFDVKKKPIQISNLPILLGPVAVVVQKSINSHTIVLVILKYY